MNKYKTLILIVVIVFIYVLMVIRTTAKYNSIISGTDNARVATFSVTVSSVDIEDGTKKQFTSGLEFVGDEELSVANGKIAPGYTASAIIEIDASGTEVSTRYTIDFEDAEYAGTGNIGLEITSVYAEYTDASGNDIVEKLTLSDITGGQECTSEIAIEDNESPVTITVTAEWTFIQTAENSFGIERADLTIPVSVTVEQID